MSEALIIAVTHALASLRYHVDQGDDETAAVLWSTIATLAANSIADAAECDLRWHRLMNEWRSMPEPPARASQEVAEHYANYYLRHARRETNQPEPRL